MYIDEWAIEATAQQPYGHHILNLFRPFFGALQQASRTRQTGMMLGSHFHIILYEPAQQFGVLTDGFMPGRIHFERGTKNVPIAVQTQQASKQFY